MSPQPGGRLDCELLYPYTLLYTVVSSVLSEVLRQLCRLKTVFRLFGVESYCLGLSLGFEGYCLGLVVP